MCHGGAKQKRAGSPQPDRLTIVQKASSCISCRGWGMAKPEVSIKVFRAAFSTADGFRNALFLIAVKYMYVCVRVREHCCPTHRSPVIVSLITRAVLSAWLLFSIQISTLSGGGGLFEFPVAGDLAVGLGFFMFEWVIFICLASYCF